VWGVLKTVVAIAVLVSVVVVCISPFVNLDPTSLSAVKAALALSLAMAGSALLLCYQVRRQVAGLDVFLPPSFSSSSLLELLCSRIC
jgi:hypothetical protein